MKNKFYITFLLISISLLANAQWTATSGPYGGNIADLERDASNNTYAIVNQNLYKSTDNGATWSKLVTTSPTSLYINDLTIVNNKFYAVYYSSFYTSTDGLTWTRTATSFPFSSGQRVLKFGPDGFIAVYGNDGIFVSKDEGVTWVQALSDNVYYVGHERTVATTNGDLYTISRSSSINNYQGIQVKKLPYPGLNGTFDPNNWQTKFSVVKSGTITTSTASPTVVGVGTSFTTELTVGSNLYTSGASPQFIGQILGITNNTTLTLSGNANITLAAVAFYQDPYQYWDHLMAFGSNVYLVTSSDFLMTQDGGATWPSIKGNITAGSFSGFGSVNTDGRVFYYNQNNSEIYSVLNPTPASHTWTITPATAFSDYATGINCWSFISTTSLLVGTNSAGVFKSNDTGATYTASTTGITGGNYNNLVVATTTNKIITTVNGSGYWSSSDGGTTWAFNTVGSYIPHAIKLSNGYILLYGSKVYRSTDNGATFPAIDATYYNHTKIVEAVNGDLYGFGYGTIARSTDHGATWVNLGIAGLPSGYCFTAAVDATNSSTPNFIFQFHDDNTSQYKLFKLVGTTATLLTSPYANYITNIFFQNSKFYAAQYSAYYYTTDLGTTWTTVGFSGNAVFPIKNASYSGIAVSRNGTLYTSQDDGGSWNNTVLPTAYPNAFITDIGIDGSGNYYASTQGSPVLKNTSQLLVDPTTLPPYISFNWQPLNGPYGGRTSKIAGTSNGSTLFAVVGNLGSTNRLWKYSGSSWAQVNPVSANGIVWDVEVDGSGNVYALTNSNPQKIYKSIDLGVTWNPLTSTGLPGTGNSIRRISVLGDGSIIAYGTNGSNGIIMKSTDAGSTFTTKFTSTNNVTYGADAANNSRKPAISPLGPIAIFGLPSEGMIVSIDNGSTWTAKAPSASILDPTKGFVGSYMYDKDGNLIMHTIVDTTIPNWVTDIYKSTNNGTSWTALNTPTVAVPGGTANYSKRIAVLGTGEYLMCIQSRFDCYRSADKGATWTNIGNVGDVFVWAYTNGSTSYIIGSSDAGILKTTDGGLTFNTFSNGIPHPNSNDIAFLNNSKDLIIGATRPYHSSDYGTTLTLASLEPGSNYLQVADSVIAYGNNRRLLKSKDGGKTWAEFGADNLYYSFLTQDATGSGFYGSDGVSLLYSTDLKSWTNIVLSGLPASYSIDNMVIDQNGVVYAVVFDNNSQQDDVYKIVFGSATKISAAIGTKNPVNIIYFNNKFYLYDGNGAIYKSTDGETWTQGSAPSGDELLASNGYLFIPSGNSVLWLSRNDGSTWQSVGDVPPASGIFTGFRNVVINPYDGYAYATLFNSVAKKSGNMVIPNDNTAPVVTTYSPAVNATGVGLKPTLSLTFNEVTNAVSGKIVRVFDLANPAVAVETMDMATATLNGKTWSIPTTTNLAFNKTYFVIIDAGAVADIFANPYAGIISNATWRFTTKNAPTVSALSPANNATNVVANSPFKISFAEPVAGVTGKNVVLYASSAPSTPVATLSATTGVSSGNDLTFTFPVSTIQYNTQYFIKADASAFTTADGGVFSAITLNTDWTFTSRGAPTVSTLAPANSSTGATLNTSLSITLSEAFTLISGKNLNVYKTSAPSTPVATVATTSGTISGNGLTVTLSSPLEFSTQYFVLIDANAFKAVSDGGIFSAVTQNTSWVFTTRAAPTVATLAPANSSTGATLNTSLSISLSEAFTLVSSKNLNVYKASAPSTPVATLATSSGTVSGNSLTVALTSPLEFNTQYFVLIDANAFKTTSDGGTFSAVTQNTNWAFTTRGAPTVSTLSPANSATNVDIKAANTKLAITLSEAFTFVSGKKIYVTNTASPSTPVFSIDLSGATFATTKATITLPGDLGYSLTYAITFDANAFTATSDGGNFSLLTTTGWQFTTATTPDTQPPSISHTQTNLAQGSGNGTISATVNDNVSVDTVKIYYRSITTGGSFTAVKLTGSNSVYSATVPETTYGPIGLEYYFTAKDGAGNLSRGPATGNYYSYISYTASTTSPLIPTAQLGIGGDVGNWRIITVPHKLGSANVATVFAVLGADDFSKWRLITYKDQTAWSQYPDDFTAFVQGTGYFINIKSLPTNSSSGILVPGAVSPSNNKAAPFSFVLKPGWNQIGNPYTFPMGWDEVMTSNNSPAGIAATLKTFNGSNYVDVANSGKLGVFEGAFVLNSGSGSVTMAVPIVGKYAGGRLASTEQTPTVSHNLANETWTTPITLKIGAVENTFGGIGMNPDASVGVDRYDDFNPPRWVDFAEMSFAHPEHFLKASTKDVVPTRQDYTWAFDVATNLNGIAELTWDNSSFGFNSKELFLVDVNKETLINMREQNSYSFDPRKSSSFKIYFGDNLQDKIKPSFISLGDAYPNPSTNTKITIPFTLPESQSTFQVEMDIYNSMGQKVFTIVNGSFNTGFYSSQWEPNENLLSGMYIYRLKVAGKENSSVISKKLIVNH